MKMIKSKIVICYFLLVLAPLLYQSSVHAIVLELYKDGKFTEEYNEKIIDLQYLFDELEESDESGKVFLKFGNEKPIQVLRPLGSGKQALVLEIEGNKILRLPIKADDQYRVELSENYKASQLISSQDKNIPIVHYEKNKNIIDGSPMEYLIGEKINIKFTFEKFWEDIIARKSIKDKSPKYKLGECEIQEIMMKLALLALKTSDFTFIGDIHKGNVAYVGNEWVIMDYGLPLKKFNYDNPDMESMESSILDQGFIHKRFIPKEVEAFLKIKLREKRMSQIKMKQYSCSVESAAKPPLIKLAEEIEVVAAAGMECHL